MDYEELYKDALERARQVHSTNVDENKKSTEYIFPELKESEDERIRKAIYNALKYLESEQSWDFLDDVDILDAYAWLEKQGEKPQGKSALEAIKEEKADNDIKIKPKFKIGQWIVWQNKCYKVNYNGCGYELVDQNGLSTSLEYGTIDENAHIWDITKAKDGDVLVASDGSIFLFEGIYNCNCKHYVALTTNNVVKFNKNLVHCWETSTAVHPATKEQSGLLFAKMKEAGYKWDANNKQLIKL